MPAIKTGRTRTLSSTGTISVTTGAFGPIVNNLAFSINLSCSFGNLGVGLTLGGWSITIGPGPHPFETIPYAVINRIGGLGVSSPLGTGAPLTDPSGTWSWSCEVEEISIYTIQNGRLSNWVIQDQPRVNGNVSGSITFNGSTLSFSGTIAAIYVTPLEARGGHSVETTVSIDPGSQLLSGSLQGVISPIFMGMALGTPFNHTYPLGNRGSQAVLDTSGGVDFSVSSTVASYAGGASCTFVQQPTKKGTVQGQVNAFEITYPGSLTCEWQNSTDLTWTPFSLGDTISLDNYSASVEGYSTQFGISGVIPGPTPFLAMGDGLACRINPTSLAAAGESNAIGWDDSLRCRLTPFNALTIWQASQYIVDPCTSASGWSSNVSAFGGYLLVNTASSPFFGLMEKAYSPPNSFEGYRFLEVDIEPNFLAPAYDNTHTYAIGDQVSSAGVNYTCILSTTGNAPPNATYWIPFASNGTLQLQLMDQSLATASPLLYDEALGVTGTLKTIRFDLIAPFAGPSGYTAFGTRVLDSKQIGGFSTVGPGWGVDNIFNFALLFPAGSGTYQVHQIRLVRDANTKVTFMQSDNSAVDAFPSPPALQRFKFALGDTDGKRSLGIGDLVLFSPASTLISGAGNPTFASIANKINGWTVTPIASSADQAAWYFSWYLSHLCGAGAIYTGTTPTTFWVDKDLTTNPTTLQVQALSQSVIFTPDCGDLVNNGSYGGPFKYYTWEFLRQRTTGVAIDTSQNPISGHTVTETEVLSGLPSGSGTTNAAGRFITGDNYARTAFTQKDILSGVTPASGTVTFPASPRDVLRIAFLGVPSNTGGPAWHHHDEMGRVHEAVVVAGDVWYRRAQFYVPDPTWLYFNQVTSFRDCTFASAGYDPSSDILYLLIERKTSGVYNLYLASSFDHGKSWTSPSLYMSTARALNPFRTQMGGFGLAWFVYNSGSAGPGTVWATARAAGDTSWPAPWQFKDSMGTAIVVADGGWSNVMPALNDQASMSWAPVINGDPDATFWFSIDNLKTWTKFT